MTIVNSFTIQEAWHESCKLCMQYGKVYTVEQGSYVGVQRKQLNALAIEIEHPEIRPFGFSYKNVPITSDKAVEQYFNDYIVNTMIPGNEQYTYGSRIMNQLEIVMQKITNSKGFTNQAILTVGLPGDLLLDDPPCLRELSWKRVENTLQLCVYFRSWDLFSALAYNLSAFQLLNEMVSELVNIPTGKLIAFSDGAHIYNHNWKTFSEEYKIYNE